MPDNITENYFYNKSNTPAWHALGINDPTEHTAVEATKRLARLNGQEEAFQILKQPLFVKMPSGELEEIPYYGLVREPIASDNCFRVIGEPVSADFESQSPIDFARMWDDVLKDANDQSVPVETLGILNKGQRMFITAALPSGSVKGDEVKFYLIFDAPFTSGISLGGYTSGVRVVCQNTLNMAIHAARDSFRVTHSKGAAQQCANWIGGMYSRSLAAASLMQEAMEVLASTKVNKTQIKWIVEGVYPFPTKEVSTDSPAIRRPLDVRQAERDAWIARIDRTRQQIMAKIDGGGIALDTPACKGTAFGVYNAVAELETHDRKGAISLRVANLINGDRGSRIMNAATLGLNVGSYKTLEPQAVGSYIPVQYN